jgi:anti-sigma factor RsiW
MIDERTERLISRKLDGELSESDALELDRALIRSPEARRMLEDYERSERQASQALHGAFADSRHADERAATWAGTAAARRRVWPGAARIAAAAMIAIVMGGLSASWFVPRLGNRASIIANRPEESPPQRADRDMGDIILTPVSARGPQLAHDRILRDVFVVVDEDTDNLYLLEMDRTQRTLSPVRVNY